MVEDAIEIVRCPPEHFAEAMALVLRDVRADHRRELVHGSADRGQAVRRSAEGLYVALRAGMLCGAVWAQRQPGNTAVLWPPQCARGHEADTAVQLLRAVVPTLDAGGVDLTQVLLPGRDPELEAVLESGEFAYLTDLSYLSCDSGSFPPQAPELAGLEFQSYQESERSRLAALIEETYVETRDCSRLNDAREIDDVIAGYQATGEYCATNWFCARAEGLDVGVLLVANHPHASQWEITYMGVVPAARGRGWGSVLTRHALWLARAAKVERVLLAVDVANAPALAIYRHAGFIAWDRRAVFVRLREKTGK